MNYFILIISLLQFGFKQPTLANGRNCEQKTDTSKLAFVNSANYPAIFDKSYKPASLTKYEIDQLEIVIGKKIAEINNEFKKSQHSKLNYINNPRNYYQQLIAVINSKGEKVVWINCLCTVENDPDWKTRIIEVLDGGACYFQIKVNLTNKIAYDLTVNGLG